MNYFNNIKNKIGMLLVADSISSLCYINLKKLVCVADVANKGVNLESIWSDSDSQKELVERFYRNFSFCSDGDLDVDADIMFEKVKTFLDQAENVKDEDFLEYEANYFLNNCGRTVKVENSDWFKQNEKSNDYLMLWGFVKKGVC